MAEYGLLIGWGVLRAGREEATDRDFREALDYWKGLEASGEIEGFELVMLGAHGGDLSGFALLRGDREKLGMRASIYNAMPMAGVEALVQYMVEFQRRHG